MSAATVTVTMPAYDAEATLAEAVASVLAQTREDWELLIVDDGSNLPAAQALADAGLEDPRIRTVRHDVNRGLGEARTTALAHTRTPLLAHLDSDDRYEPRYLERLIPALDDPQVALAYPNVRIFGDTDELYITDPSLHPADRFPALALSNPIPNFTVVRRACIEQVGGYARFTWGAMDWYLYLRLAGAGWKFAYVDEVLAHYRWSDLSMSKDWDRVQRSNLAVLTHFMLHHPFVRGPHRRAARLAAREAARRVPGVAAVKGRLDARR